jgi:cation:H+ antiporter
MSNTLLLLGGFVLLIVGGELLVRGAVSVAQRYGMSPLLIGLTLVGFGTSTPELVTSVQASLSGSPGIAVGNIVGSNIANILLILGLSAIITPIAVGSNALKRDGVLVVGTAALLTAVGYFTSLDRVVGAGFIAMLIAYIAFAYRQETGLVQAELSAAHARSKARDELHVAERFSPPTAPSTMATAVPLLMALAGLVLVVFGGKLLVDGAVALARDYGISETVIGLTIVAVGTSMPEFVTSVVAALRKHADVALGNILGSNIYNVLGIGGATGLMSPTIIPSEIASFDNFIMLAASVALLVFAATGRRIGRTEGALLLAGYAAYLFVLWPK